MIITYLLFLTNYKGRKHKGWTGKYIFLFLYLLLIFSAPIFLLTSLFWVLSHLDIYLHQLWHLPHKRTVWITLAWNLHVCQWPPGSGVDIPVGEYINKFLIPRVISKMLFYHYLIIFYSTKRSNKYYLKNVLCNQLHNDTT